MILRQYTDRARKFIETNDCNFGLTESLSKKLLAEHPDMLVTLKLCMFKQVIFKDFCFPVGDHRPSMTIKQAVDLADTITRSKKDQGLHVGYIREMWITDYLPTLPLTED